MGGVKLLEPPATGLLLALVALAGLTLLGVAAVRRLAARPRAVVLDRSVS